MKKSKVELKPCPFCGGEAEVRQFANPKNFYSIECATCHCRTDGHRTNQCAGTDDENISANVDVWNQRTNMEKTIKPLPQPCVICKDHKVGKALEIRNDEGVLYKTSHISHCPYCGRFIY